MSKEDINYLLRELMNLEQRKKEVLRKLEHGKISKEKAEDILSDIEEQLFFTRAELMELKSAMLTEDDFIAY